MAHAVPLGNAQDICAVPPSALRIELLAFRLKPVGAFNTAMFTTAYLPFTVHATTRDEPVRRPVIAPVYRSACTTPLFSLVQATSLEQLVSPSGGMIVASRPVKVSPKPIQTVP